jgi:hypothetical protein
MTETQRLYEEALITGLPPAVRDAVDRLLAKGQSKDTILKFVRGSARRAAHRAGRGDASQVQLTALAVEAYLNRR